MKIICIGRNYVAHAQELANEVPTSPVVFLKPQTALLKSGEAFYHPEFSKDIHYECELVLRIGKSGKYIQEEFAHKYIDAYTLGIDFTARDLQEIQKQKGLPWEIAKAFDNSAVCGKFIATKDIRNELPIRYNFYQNNVLKQNGDTSLLIFSIEKIMAYISQFFTLQQGDLIYTGTPAGVGKINIGDVLHATINDHEMFNVIVK
jgi:2-keto-4-pentenoate hydratase/2-oxohepta-3-ene-1,7-dioic acid hydratase in catechol pathway